MSDLIAELISIVSILGVVVVILMVIRKERNRRKNKTRAGSGKIKKPAYEKSGSLYLS